ncbi:Lob domain-containing protein [Thalictrum thalictroides]|uniref:Lob domain-containing protein n=1 Tax=Thalictrum thalictroides TaxID=46969 RepID=A0A7J6WWP9_THATH|nr:Lob domain-containing protein [Thalictrum thalictroides]
MQQKANGIHQACAACKHQRKKCADTCVLAPFFPLEKNQQFLAVHKVFGVSNVSKILKGLNTRDEREKAIDTLVWEAQWRQRDPVLGCYGAYKKISDELKIFKNQHIAVPTYSDAMLYKTGLIGWPNNNVPGAEINFNNPNYIENNGNFPMEAIPFNYAQGQNNGVQQRDTVPGSICSGNSMSCLSQQFYHNPDQYARMNVKSDKAT